MKRIALLLGALGAALPLWPAVAASPAPSPTPTASGRPVSRGIPISFAIVPGKPLLPGAPPPTARTPRYFQLALAPGASSSDWVAVANPSTTPLSVRMGVSDEVTLPRNAATAFNDGGRQQAIGQWVRLATGDSVVTVPPRSIRLIGLTISIPSSVPPGEYEGTINGTNQQTTTVQAGRRTVALQGTIRCIVYLRVTGVAHGGLAVGTVGVAHTQGHTVLALALRNTGTVIDRACVVTVTFTGHALPHPYTFQVPIGSIMGQAATTVTFLIDHGVPAGAYRVDAQIAYRAQVAASGPPQDMQAAWHGALTVR